MAITRLALTLVLVALPGSAAAGLYKCELDNGITYQQTPCPPGRELRDFGRDPATVSVVPFTIAPESPARQPASAPRSHAPATSSHAAAKTRPGKGTDSASKAAERKFLIPGIDQGEVLARIGKPDLKSGASRKTMRWTYLPVPDDPSTITTLTFQEGRLIEVERKIVRPR